MKTQFRKVEPTGDPPEPGGSESAQAILVPWIAPATPTETARQLFDFLQALRLGGLRAVRPLLLDNAALQSLYRHPPASLVQALHYQLDSLLVDITPDPAQWGEMGLSPAMVSLSLAAYLCLTPNLVPADERLDPVLGFAAALVGLLPPARTLPEALVYHAILAGMGSALPHLSPGRQAILGALLNRSPLSAVYHLHLYTPPALTPLAAQLMPWWKRRVTSPSPWRGPEDWLQTMVPLLAQPALANYLRRHWLELPETRPACRNLGLLLEALRRQENQRDFLLTFYEAYDHQRGRSFRDPWDGRAYHTWPLLVEIERLLRAGSSSDGASAQAALNLNRRGNEMFLLFYPLIETIKTDGHPPTDFNLLTNNLILASSRLLDWVTLHGASGLKMGQITFDEPSDA